MTDGLGLADVIGTVFDLLNFKFWNSYKMDTFLFSPVIFVSVIYKHRTFKQISKEKTTKKFKFVTKIM